MNLFRSTLVAIFIFISIHALAQNPVVVVEPPQADSIYRDSSEFNRLNKNFSIETVVVGYGPSRATTVGFNLGIFLDRNSLIEIQALGGRPITLSFLNSYDIYTRSFGVHYKHFHGNSFYWAAGLDYRSVDYKSNAYDLFNSSVLETRTFDGSSLGPSLVIGNQWSWENFTLGCDWIGFYLPITSQVNSEKESSGAPNAYSRSLKDEEDYYIKSSSTIGLRFYLGASF